MTKFIIDKIHLRNVRGYGDEGIDMDFPLGNTTVFTGKVGAGKSTILKAVSMALYGEDGGVKNEKLSIDDMINERNGKNLEIELYFRSIDTLDNDKETKYEIHLYHKHSKYQNKLVFMKDGVDISANGKMDTYRLIQKTIIPKDVYHNIYYFTQQAKNFFTALPNSEQKAIFDSILDLSEYNRYYQNCRKNITEYEQLISKCELELNLLKSSVEEKTRLIEGEKANIAQLTENNANELKSLQANLADLKAKLEQLKADSSLDFNVAEIDAKLAELQAKQQSLEGTFNLEVQNLNTKIEAVKTNIQNEFSQAKVAARDKLEPVVKSIQDKIATATNAKHELEKQCSEAVSKTENERIQAENAINLKYNDKLMALKEEITKLETELATAKSGADAKVSELKVKATGLKSERDMKLDKLQTVLTQEKTNLARLEKEIADKNAIIERNTKELNSEHPHCDKCGQALVNVDHLKLENQQLQTVVDDLTKKKQEVVNNSTKITEVDLPKITNDCETELNKLRTELKTISDTYNAKKAQIESSVTAKQQEVSTLEKSKTEEVEGINKSYEMKKTNVSSEYSQKIQEQETLIANYGQDIELETNKAKQSLIELSKTLTEKQTKEVKVIEDEIAKVNKRKTDEYDNINSMMSTLRTKKLAQTTVESRIKELEENVHSTEVQITMKSNYKAPEDTLKNLIESKQHDEDGLKAQEKRHDDLRQTLDILEFWKTAFSDSGIKSMLIDVAIPHMNQCVREELDRVCPGTFTVSFDTLSQTKAGEIRDKFAINITHNVKCATGHKKLSGGEKRIIDFCCMAALRSLAEKLYQKQFCHIFYDEVLDSLDSESRELFCRSMKHQSSDQRHVLLVTHQLTEDVEPDRVFPF